MQKHNARRTWGGLWRARCCGDVTISGLSGATAKIGTNTGASSTGLVDLSGAARAFNVADGAAAIDLDIAVPVVNGALVKTGLGTMSLSNASNSYSGGTTVQHHNSRQEDRRPLRPLGHSERVVGAIKCVVML